LGQIGVEPPEIGCMRRPDPGAVVDRDLVGRRVVEAGEEQGVVRDVDPAGPEAGADVRIVQDGGGDAGVGLARMAAAGAAVEAGGVRVVDGGAAMAHQQDEAREAAGQRHGAQHGFGHRQALPGGEPGLPPDDAAASGAGIDAGIDARIDPGAGPPGGIPVQAVDLGMGDRPGQPQAVADNLPGEGEAHRLDIGEG
jgi:hypothetical protein